MGKATVCHCSHEAGFHRHGGKGACMFCSACNVFRPHRPPAPSEGQLAFWEGCAHERARLYDALRAAGANGATFEELARAAAMNHNTVRGRLSEMAREGTIIASTRRRDTRSGREATVYLAPEYHAVAESRATELRARLARKGKVVSA